MKSPSKEKMLIHKEYGEKRVESERALLSLMFNGFGVMTLSGENNDFEHVCMIESECSLEEYTHMVKANAHPSYSKLSNEAKKYFHAIIALNTLTKQGLTERHVWCFHSESDEHINSNIDIEKHIELLSHDLTLPYHQREFHEYLYQNPTVSYRLVYITYTLTNKGYDVALKFLEHSNQEKRFTQQSDIAIEAKKASVSSAKTARRAIYAATAIALASIANVIIALYNKYG